MNTKITEALDCLAVITANSTNYESFVEELASNKEDVSTALELLGNADKEDLIEATHLGLWRLCPDEFDYHVMGAKSAYLTIISVAQTQLDFDFGLAVQLYINKAKGVETPKLADKEDAALLERCFSSTETSGGESWKF